MKVKNRYAKGYRNERRSIDLLRGRDWLCFRTAGSHTDWDIIALKKGWYPMLVQVKTNRKPGIKATHLLPSRWSAAIVDRENTAWGDYDSMWSLRIHVWTDYKGLKIFDARTGTEVDFV